MPRRIILLTGSFEAGLILPHFTKQAAPRPVLHAVSRADLDRLLRDDPEGSRLVAFCSSTIVAKHQLERLGAPAYNIHPGPPDFPGRHPESWGAYHGARRFGATIHEMAPRVDEGAIVDVEWVDMVPGSGQSEFGIRAFRAALTLLMRWSGRMVTDDAALPHGPYLWSGRKTSHADLLAMCRVPPGLDAAEFERRRNAFAQQPGSEMTIDFHGTIFRWVAPSEDEVRG